MASLRLALTAVITACTSWPCRCGPYLKQRPSKPNIVWILTDDQDQMLGASFPLTSAATPMPKTKRLMQDEGIHAENWYIHTPICSPSRSELLTGRYYHNIKKVGGFGYCSGMHVDYDKVNNHSFARILQEQAGYTTGMFGKYLNEMPATVPLGWDAWLANGGGDYIAPAFQTHNIDGLPDGHVKFTNSAANYSTSVIGNVSIAWIRKAAAKRKPFFAYIAPKAAHEPFNPAPWYRDAWDASWPTREPISENWNCSAASRRDHHGNIATEPMISERASKVITGVFKNRWRTLMSVDDLIADVIKAVDDLGLSNFTYFLFSSDHGFQLGQFNIPMDKRHVYEWDTKIHLLARGPGIPPGTSFSQPGTQVDIAPTLLGFAGLPIPTDMDGKSILPFLISDRSVALRSSLRHLIDAGDVRDYAANWRQEVFLEMYFCDRNIKCVENCEWGHYPKQDANCADLAANDLCWCGGGSVHAKNCYATEDQTNNFIALRQLTPGSNNLYAEFMTGSMSVHDVDFSRIDFLEMYDLDSDPWQMRNLARNTSEQTLDLLHQRLHMWARCAGPTCDPNLWHKQAADSDSTGTMLAASSAVEPGVIFSI